MPRAICATRHATLASMVHCCCAVVSSRDTEAGRCSGFRNGHNSRRRRQLSWKMASDTQKKEKPAAGEPQVNSGQLRSQEDKGIWSHQSHRKKNKTKSKETKTKKRQNDTISSLRNYRHLKAEAALRTCSSADVHHQNDLRQAVAKAQKPDVMAN